MKGLYLRSLDFEKMLIEESAGNESGRLNTDIDRLYYMVRSAGRVSVTKASRTLHIEKKQLEEFARILADNNLLAIRRPLVGDFILESVDGAPDSGKAATLVLIILAGALAVGVHAWNAHL